MRSQELSALRLQVLPLFHTSEDAKSIALKFQVSPKSLRKWWYEEFGRVAVAARGKAILIKCNESRGHVLGVPKQCPRCGLITTEFGASTKNSNRPRSWCSSCGAKYSKSRRESETLDERAIRLSLQKEVNTVYYAEHAEELRAYARQYRAEHPDRNAKIRQYFIDHPERMLLQNAKARANRFNVPFNITSEDVLSCMPNDHICPITSLPFERGVGKLGPASMSLDRIIPALGYVPGNIAVISHSANTMKSACIDPNVFRRVAFYIDGSLKVPLEGSDLSPSRWIINSARQRAKVGGFPFNITKHDIEACIPSDGCCPITRQPMLVGTGKVGPASMSLDRIKPSLGYVKGNIAVISHLANTIKQNSTDPQVFMRLADYVTQGVGRKAA